SSGAAAVAAASGAAARAQRTKNRQSRALQRMRTGTSTRGTSKTARRESIDGRRRASAVVSGRQGRRRHKKQRERQNQRERDRDHVVACSSEMLRRFIISCSVVGFTLSSSAACFCTPPEASSARRISRRS